MDFGGDLFEHPIVTSGLIAVPAFLITTIIFLGMAIYNAFKVRSSQGWHSTTGRITRSEVVEKRTNGRNTYKIPVIVYEYEAAAQHYKGTRVNFGAEGRSTYIEFAKRKVDKYPVGSTVEVFYDPNNPAESVLSRSAPLTLLWLGLAGLMLLLMIISAVIALPIYNSQVLSNLPR